MPGAMLPPPRPGKHTGPRSPVSTVEASITNQPAVDATAATATGWRLPNGNTAGAGSTTALPTRKSMPSSSSSIITKNAGRGYHSTAGRIEKNKKKPTRQPASTTVVKNGKRNGDKEENDLRTKFEESLEATRKEISETADRDLEEMENRLIAELTDMARKMMNKLNRAAESEERIYFPVAQVQLEITRNTPVKGMPDKEVVTFGARMQEFEQIVEKEKENLQRLWKEWIDVQMDTTCLAIEMLGPDAVSDLPPEEVAEGDLNLKVKLNAAGQAHQQNAEDAAGARARSSELEKSVKELTSQTLTTLKAQQQEWKLEQRKIQQSIREKFNLLSML